MKIEDYVWTIACCLILVNIVGLIMAAVKKAIGVLQILLIVILSIGIPYLVAFITSLFYSDWEGFGIAIAAMIYAVFTIMVLLNIYLFRKLEIFKS